MPRHLITTQIHISAPPAAVWQVLMEFDAYGEWNPFVTSISGKPDEGATLEITAGGMDFRPTVEVYRSESEFVWQGKLWVKGLIDGRHSFNLERVEDGGTLFTHSESFDGLLIPLFRNKLETDTRSGFEKMNEALKLRTHSL